MYSQQKLGAINAPKLWHMTKNYIELTSNQVSSAKSLESLFWGVGRGGLAEIGGNRTD